MWAKDTLHLHHSCGLIIKSILLCFLFIPISHAEQQVHDTIYFSCGATYATTQYLVAKMSLNPNIVNSQTRELILYVWNQSYHRVEHYTIYTQNYSKAWINATLRVPNGSTTGGLRFVNDANGRYRINITFNATGTYTLHYIAYNFSEVDYTWGAVDIYVSEDLTNAKGNGEYEVKIKEVPVEVTKKVEVIPWWVYPLVALLCIVIVTQRTKLKKIKNILKFRIVPLLMSRKRKEV